MMPCTLSVLCQCEICSWQLETIFSSLSWGSTACQASQLPGGGRGGWAVGQTPGHHGFCFCVYAVFSCVGSLGPRHAGFLYFHTPQSPEAGLSHTLMSLPGTYALHIVELAISTLQVSLHFPLLRGPLMTPMP